MGTLLLERLPLYNLCNVVANMKSTGSLVDVSALMACHSPIVGEYATICDGTEVLVLSTCLICVV
jgi:hypothetical protein